MTVRSVTQVHFDAGDVRHEHAPTHSVLILDDYRADLTVHFNGTAQVDAVIAELVALRAEMDAPPSINGDRHPAPAVALAPAAEEVAEP